MKKRILVPDFYNTLAAIAIASKVKPSTTELVLAEIIRQSEEGVILQPTQLSATVCKNISITPENYRAAFSKIVKMNLITKEHIQAGSKKIPTIKLSPIIKTPVDTLIISENVKEL